VVVIPSARWSSSPSVLAIVDRLLIFKARRLWKRGRSKVLNFSLWGTSTCFCPHGRTVRRGWWSEVASRCFATLAHAPAKAREPDTKVRSRVLTLSCVGVSISEINTNPSLSSYLVTGSAKADGPC
jgi:hypothetical protein